MGRQTRVGRSVAKGAGPLAILYKIIEDRLLDTPAVSDWLTWALPNWLLAGLVGLSLGAWVFDPRRGNLWDRWFAYFEVEHVHAGQWVDSPESDLGVRARIRFKRAVKERPLRLRVFSVTGRARKPFQHVINLGDITAAPGEARNVQIATLGVPRPGWDHTKKRGWGPDCENMPSFIGESDNVAVLELEGRLYTQKHKFFVSMIKHTLRDATPSIYVQDEDDDVFETSESGLRSQQRI